MKTPLLLAGFDKPSEGGGKVISFYCPEPLLKELNRLAEKIGKTKRSHIIVLALKRTVPMLARQLDQGHIPSKNDFRRMERIKTLGRAKSSI